MEVLEMWWKHKGNRGKKKSRKRCGDENSMEGFSDI